MKVEYTIDLCEDVFLEIKYQNLDPELKLLMWQALLERIESEIDTINLHLSVSCLKPQRVNQLLANRVRYELLMDEIDYEIAK